MAGYVNQRQPRRVVLLTECSMSDNVAARNLYHPQSLPAHETEHAAEDPARARDYDARGDHRSGRPRRCATLGCAHAGGVEGMAMQVPPLPQVMIEPLVRDAAGRPWPRRRYYDRRRRAAGGARRDRIGGAQTGRGRRADFALAAFRLIDPVAVVKIERPDGSRLMPGDRIATISGPARGILTRGGAHGAEFFVPPVRCFATRGVVDAITAYKTAVVCTARPCRGCGRRRNTLCGRRRIDTASVLDDAVLIKDNHVAIAGGIRSAVARVRAGWAIW